MKLTKNQIDELYKFTRKHYVYHYDVQSELVDHLANDIEEYGNKHQIYPLKMQKTTHLKNLGFWVYGCNRGQTKTNE